MAKARLQQKLQEREKAKAHDKTASTPPVAGGSAAAIQAKIQTLSLLTMNAGAGVSTQTNPKRSAPKPCKNVEKSEGAGAGAGAGTATAAPALPVRIANPVTEKIERKILPLEDARKKFISAATPEDSDFLIRFFSGINHPQASKGAVEIILKKKIEKKEFYDACIAFMDSIFSTFSISEQRIKYIQDNHAGILKEINQKINRPEGRDREFKEPISYEHIHFDFKDFPNPHLLENDSELHKTLNQIKANMCEMYELSRPHHHLTPEAHQIIESLILTINALLFRIDKKKYIRETMNLHRIILDLAMLKGYYIKEGESDEQRSNVMFFRTSYLQQAPKILNEIKNLWPEEEHERWFKSAEAFVTIQKKQFLGAYSNPRGQDALIGTREAVTRIIAYSPDALDNEDKLKGRNEFFAQQKKATELLGYPPPEGKFIEDAYVFDSLWTMAIRKIRLASNHNCNADDLSQTYKAATPPDTMELELDFLNALNELLELLRVTIDGIKLYYFKASGDLAIFFPLMALNLEIYAKYRDSNQSAELYLAESALDNLARFSTRYYGMIRDDNPFPEAFDKRLNELFPEYKDESLAVAIDIKFRLLIQKSISATIDFYLKHFNSDQREELVAAQEALGNLKRLVEDYIFLEDFSKKSFNDAFLEYKEGKPLTSIVDNRLKLIQQKIDRAEVKARKAATAEAAQRNREEARIREQKLREEKRLEDAAEKHYRDFIREAGVKADRIAQQAEAARIKYELERKNENDRRREAAKNNPVVADAVPEAKRTKKPAAPPTPLTEQEKKLEKANTWLGDLRKNKVPEDLKKLRAVADLKNPNVLATDYAPVIKMAKDAAKLAEDNLHMLTVAKSHAAIAECYIGQTHIHLQHRRNWSDAEHKFFEQEMQNLYKEAAAAADTAHNYYINLVEPHKEQYDESQKIQLESACRGIKAVLEYANNLAGGTKQNLVDENKAIQAKFDESIRRRNEALKKKAEREAKAAELKAGAGAAAAAAKSSAAGIGESKDEDDLINDDLIEKEGLRFKHNRKIKTEFARQREEMKKTLERNKHLIKALEACETLLIAPLEKFRFLTNSEAGLIEAPKESKDGEPSASPSFLDRVTTAKNRPYPALGTATHFRSPTHAGAGAGAGAGVTPAAEREYSGP